MTITYNILKQWIDMLRETTEFEVKFVTNPMQIPREITEVLPATIGRPNPQRVGKRLKSAHEYHTPKVSNATKNHKPITCFSTLNTNHDEIHLSHVKKRKERYGCFLCRQAECGRWNCAKLRAYDGTILPKNDEKARQKFGALIIRANNGIVELRETSDKRVVMETIPKKVRALVVHRKINIKDNAFGTLDDDNVAIEVTLLREGGDPFEDYKEALFRPFCVYKWITHNKSSLVTHCF